MSINETLEDLTINSDSGSQPTAELNSELHQTTQAEAIPLDVEPNSTEAPTLDEEGNPIAKELSDEEKAQIEAEQAQEQAQLKLENDQKSEREKLRKVESENYNLQLTHQVLGSLSVDPEKTLTDLVSDKNKFDRVIHNLAKANPNGFNNPNTGQPYNYKDFTLAVSAIYEGNAKADPNQYEKVRQLDEAKSKAELESKISSQEQVLEIKYSLKAEIPEFAELLKADSNQANKVLEHALNTASQKYGFQLSQGITPTVSESEQMIKEAIYFINPNWQKSKQINPNLKSQTAKILNTTIKGASTTTNSSSTIDDVKSLPSDKQDVYNQLISFYNKCGGYTAEEIHKKAIQGSR